MGRSNGYRPKAAVRKEVLALRERLAQLTDDQWVKASFIMQEITALLGHASGPMNGRIEPRSCRYCRHFGHTKQWCKVRIRDQELREQRECDELLAEDHALGIDGDGYNWPDTEWSRWCQLAKAANADLYALKEDWSDGEWEVEFRKRAGDFDHTLKRINLYHAPLAAETLGREMDEEGPKLKPQIKLRG